MTDLATAPSIRHSLNRFAAALADPARAARTMPLSLCGYALLWTLYGVLAKASQDIHFDMGETVAWSRELALGYSKHPPLTAYVTGLWFLVFPHEDWAYYLLAMASASLALVIAWLIARDYLNPAKSAAAVALLTFVPFFNFHALKFNPNAILLPLWAVTTFFFLRSYETRRPLYAILAGVAAGAAMLGKYWSIVLLAGLVIAALCDTRRAVYFRSAAPWLTVLAGAIVIAPHTWWLIADGMRPIAYASSVHGTTLSGAALSTLEYLSGMIGYAVLPIALALVIFRPSRAALKDALWPRPVERRLVAFAFWIPLFIPLALAVIASTKVTSIWTMSAWSLMPVVLLSPSSLQISREALSRLLAIAIAVPVIAVAAAPFVAIAVHQGGLPVEQTHTRTLSDHVGRLWRETTSAPLRAVCGDLGLVYVIAHYHADKPRSCPLPLEEHAHWMTPERLARDGAALVCFVQDLRCEILLRERNLKAARSEEIDVARTFWGVTTAPRRYRILTLAPRAPAQ